MSTGGTTDGMHDAAGMVASNQRAIPLKTRPDLETAEIEYLGVGYRVVKDPIGLKYHRLQVEQYHVLELLDGQRSLEEVRDELKKTYPTVQLQLSDIQQLITDLHKKGLLQTDRTGQAGALIRERRKEQADKLKQKLMSLLYFRLPGWDPEKTLQWLHPMVKFLWHPAVIAVCWLFVASAWLLLAANFDVFRSKLPEFEQFFGWPNLLYMWATLGVAKIIHEFGHGVSCKHYGGECHEMGVMMLVFSPCLYCDVTDSWMLKNKWQRIIIAAAGMYIEVILSAVAIYVWWFTKPGLVNYLALNTFFVTTITTVIFNANPLMRFDGYYMMSDFLEIPNLRAKSDKLLRESFGWYCLGIEAKPDPFMPETGKAWFITYAIAAWLYRWVILFSISLFLYTVLKPYDLQSVGVVLCIVSMSGIFFSMGKNLYQMITAPRLEPLSKPKIAITCTIAGLVVLAGLSIPIPWHVNGPFTIEPKNLVEMNVNYPGQLMTPEQVRKKVESMELGDPVREIAEIGLNYTKRIKPGDIVQKGQILAVLEDRFLEEELRELETQIEMEEKQRDNYDDLDMNAKQEETEKNLKTLAAKKESIKTFLRKRVLTADCSGIVIAPVSRPEPQFDEANQHQVTMWHGTPLDDRNANCFLDAGEHFCSIAPVQDYEVFLYMDQTDLADVSVDDEVELKFEHLPGVTYTGEVALISELGEFFAPEPLSNKYGGSLTTVTDKQGRERLVSRAFRVVVRLNTDLDLLKP
ncbi:MAG: hypothetical protein AB8G99_26395, partial [Planctomycetaceae bacterium]